MRFELVVIVRSGGFDFGVEGIVGFGTHLGRALIGGGAGRRKDWGTSLLSEPFPGRTQNRFEIPGYLSKPRGPRE